MRGARQGCRKLVMKLTNIFPQVKTEKIQARKTGGSSAVKPVNPGAVEPDRVELSANSMEIQKAREIIEETPTVRPERVKALKEQIEQGGYQVDPYKVADKMLVSLLSDHVVED